jgi:hypothetical protein
VHVNARLFRLFGGSSKISENSRHFPVAFEKCLGHIAPVAATQRPSATDYPRPSTMSGCSSGVEHNLAKVGVERSNRFTRSILSKAQLFSENPHVRRTSLAYGLAALAGSFAENGAGFWFLSWRCF